MTHLEELMDGRVEFGTNGQTGNHVELLNETDGLRIQRGESLEETVNILFDVV
jgi:hypothetical protein